MSQARVVADMIRGGAVDDDIDAIYDALKARRTHLDAERALTLHVGDSVRFTDAEWRNVTGVITEAKRTGSKFTVRLTIPRSMRVGRRTLHPDQLWTMPASMIELLPIAPTAS